MSICGIVIIHCARVLATVNRTLYFVAILQPEILFVGGGVRK